MSNHQNRNRAAQGHKSQTAGYPDLMPAAVVSAGPRSENGQGSQTTQIAAYRLIMALGRIPSTAGSFAGKVTALRSAASTEKRSTPKQAF